MTAYTTYLDDSGTPNQGRLLVVAGWVAKVEQWKKFEESWRAILDDDGIDYFHMTEFTHSVKQFAKGWKADESRRQGFLRKLILTIQLRVRVSVSCACLWKLARM